MNTFGADSWKVSSFVFVFALVVRGRGLVARAPYPQMANFLKLDPPAEMTFPIPILKLQHQCEVSRAEGLAFFELLANERLEQVVTWGAFR